MNGDGTFALKKGISYIFTEDGVARAFEGFKRLLAEGRRGLVISRTHPSRVQLAHALDCPIMWIAKSTKAASSVLSLEPTRLMKIHSTIADFVKTTKGAVILLDGLEYLITENGFTPVMKAIQLTNEEVAMNDALLLVPVDPRTLETQQLGYLEREFTLPDESSRRIRFR
ncbi:MAG: DUF835 domain-containing protein [Methanobacteriota archaeon]|nr:MAG: DUF835 domain-containing protein [Euryarchaeota archaeon]